MSLLNVHMQCELAEFGRQSLLTSLELVGKITWVTAQSLGAQGDEVVLPLLDLSKS